jgi:hypothetical protein
MCLKSFTSRCADFSPARRFAQNGAATRRIIGHVSDTCVPALFSIGHDPRP